MKARIKWELMFNIVKNTIVKNTILVEKDSLQIVRHT